MSVEDNKRTVTKLFDALSAFDAAAMGDLMTAEASWWALGWGPREKSVARGAFLDGFAEKMAQLFRGGIEFTIKGVTAEGDRVAVEADSNAELVKGGTYKNLYHFLFIFEGGKIKSVREYADTAYMRASFDKPAGS